MLKVLQIYFTFRHETQCCLSADSASEFKYNRLAYFPGVARVFIYPNLIVICVPSLADNFYTPWRYITHSSADLHTVTSSQ
jgi:hypothetical protein